MWVKTRYSKPAQMTLRQNNLYYSHIKSMPGKTPEEYFAMESRWEEGEKVNR